LYFSDNVADMGILDRIPRCMGTQHPDNVNTPFFAQNSELGGEDEVQEAYYAFSHLGCDEQMWDCEGKEFDNYVVKKLLTRYESYFSENKLGKDVFLTLRVPNPSVERAEAKILLETLESIPRSFDAANLFYGDETPPIFEVILPMAGSAQDVDRIYRYYRDFVVGKQHQKLGKGDISIAEWIGGFKPETINVIPLFEEMEQLLRADEITEAYMKGKSQEYQRVFLAHSDPAMNYGMTSAVLLNLVALDRLDRMSARVGVPICPILGVGSAPFRGNLRPDTVGRISGSYPSVYTFSIQSAFKYDYHPEEVTAAIDLLRKRKIKAAVRVDEKRCIEIIQKVTKCYQSQIAKLAPLVNQVANFIPSRRKRKMHVGLFGYSRNVDGISLPRAIKFCAALYSIGLPPELLGLAALNRDDYAYIKQIYPEFEEDLLDALRYLNPKGVKVAAQLGVELGDIPFEGKVSRSHRDVTSHILSGLDQNNTEAILGDVLRAGSIRHFLG